MENKRARIYLGSYKGKVSSAVKDRGNDPYFVEKAEEAWKTLDRVGLPQDLVEIRNKKIRDSKL